MLKINPIFKKTNTILLVLCQRVVFPKHFVYQHEPRVTRPYVIPSRSFSEIIIISLHKSFNSSIEPSSYPYMWLAQPHVDKMDQKV